MAYYDRWGFDKDGYNRNGFNKMGFDRDGYNKLGYDIHGFNRQGINQITQRDRDGYDADGYDVEGFNRDGYDQGGPKRARWSRSPYVAGDQYHRAQGSSPAQVATEGP